MPRVEERLRLLYLIGGFQVGGTEKLMVRLLEQLERDQFDIMVGCYARQGPLLAEVQGLGYDPVELPLQPTHRSRANWVYRTAQWLRQQRFDVVHCLQGTMIMYGGLAARLARGPAVVSCERNMGYWLTSASYRIAWHLACRCLVDLIVANAAVIKQRLVSQAGVRASKVRVIHDGVPVEALPGQDQTRTIRRQLGLNGDDLVVGLVATLRPVKGVDCLIEAATLLEPSIQFVIVGDGPLRTTLEQQAQILGLEERVHFLGYQPDPISIIPTFDVGVLSSYSEGFPRTVLEYMACGRPVVATLVGGVPECVVDGETGYLVEPGSPTALAEAIRALLYNPPLREQMGLAGYQRVSSEFSLEREKRLYEDAYLCLK